MEKQVTKKADTKMRGKCVEESLSYGIVLRRSPLIQSIGFLNKDKGLLAKEEPEKKPETATTATTS